MTDSRKIAGTFAALTMLVAASDAEALQVSMTYDGGVILIGDDASGLAPTGDDRDTSAGSILYEDAASPSQFAGFTQLEVLGARCTLCPRTLTLEVEATNAQPVDLLVVEVTDTGFSTGSALSVFEEAELAGIARGGSLTMEAFWDPGDTAFAKTNLIGSASGTSVFSGDIVNGPIGSVLAPYSMTMVYTFDLAGQQSTMQAIGQTRLNPVPVPAALPLMASALGFLGVWRLRRRAA